MFLLGLQIMGIVSNDNKSNDRVFISRGEKKHAKYFGHITGLAFSFYLNSYKCLWLRADHHIKLNL